MLSIKEAVYNISHSNVLQEIQIRDFAIFMHPYHNPVNSPGNSAISQCFLLKEGKL